MRRMTMEQVTIAEIPTRRDRAQQQSEGSSGQGEFVIGVDLVLATRPNATTGIERYALNLFAALRDIAPGSIAFVDRSTSLIDGPDVVRVRGGFPGWMSLPAMPAFRQRKPDILLSPAFPPSPLMLATGIPVARIIHDDFPWTRTKKLNVRGRALFKHFEKLAAPRYHAVYAPTDLMARSLSTILRREVGTIGNAPGIDLAKAPEPRTRQQQVIAVGTIEPRKNYEALLGALAHLPVDWTGAVVGRNGWGPIAADWDTHVARNAGRLAWHGHASDEALLALYRESACFVSMSFAEGFNMPLVEAGSLGLPVVVSDIEIHRSVAPPWARFVPLSASPEALAQALLEAAALTITPSAIEAYRRTFSWDNIARELRSRLLP
jgi:glycosyltransferase involved in cell wall biosynthesis